MRRIAAAVLCLVMVSPALVGCAVGTRIGLIAESSTPGTRVHIVIDAIDNKGNKGGNLSNAGGPYPYDIVRVTPFEHFFVLHAGVSLSVSMRVYTLNDKAGGWIGCTVTRDRVAIEIASHRKKVTGPNTSVLCRYTAVG
jgi:hypothetical protein